MKRILMTAALLAALVSPALSQPVQMCFDPTQYRDGVRSEFGMIPLWHSIERGGVTVIMLMNPKTELWSIVKGDEEKVCVVLAGQGFKPIVMREPK